MSVGIDDFEIALLGHSVDVGIPIVHHFNIDPRKRAVCKRNDSIAPPVSPKACDRFARFQGVIAGGLAFIIDQIDLKLRDNVQRKLVLAVIINIGNVNDPVLACFAKHADS